MRFGFFSSTAQLLRRRRTNPSILICGENGSSTLRDLVGRFPAGIQSPLPRSRALMTITNGGWTGNGWSQFAAGTLGGGCLLRSMKFLLQRNRYRFPLQRFTAWQQSSRRSFTMTGMTPDGVVLGLVGVNVAVFLLWRVADEKFMQKNFMISLNNFKSGRLHTLITHAFSHADAGHLFTNMIGLYFFGSMIGKLFGPSFLLKLYLGGALGGSIFYLAHKSYIASNSQNPRGWYISRTPALGASAAVNAIILLDIFLFPRSMCYVYFMIPIPAVALGALLIGSDLWRLHKGDSRVSGAAHLGGAAVAAITFACIKKGLI